MVTSWLKLSLAVPTSVKDDLFLTMRAMVLTQQKRVEESPLTQRLPRNSAATRKAPSMPAVTPAVVTKFLSITTVPSPGRPGNWCMWESHPEYWELWYIRAGEVRPTNDGNPKIPSFGPNAAKDDNWDDNYMTGMICDRRFRPRSRTGAITKGWVRFTGKAALYRVVDLQRWDSNWQQKFPDV